jgi:cob(I)alamin adenosyltransferase
MLYTGKGDKGDTGLFGTKQRFRKSASRIDALGSLDELNAFLGLAKIKVGEVGKLGFLYLDLKDIQEAIFILQAEIAGADKSISKERLDKLESKINDIEKKLHPINSFLILGETEVSALLDVCRTICRRVERGTVEYIDEVKMNNGKMFSDLSLAYVNRLSTFFYASARLANQIENKDEEAPSYL